jgi:hypothetical protein
MSSAFVDMSHFEGGCNICTVMHYGSLHDVVCGHLNYEADRTQWYLEAKIRQKIKKKYAGSSLHTLLMQQQIKQLHEKIKYLDTRTDAQRVYDNHVIKWQRAQVAEFGCMDCKCTGICRCSEKMWFPFPPSIPQPK